MVRSGRASAFWGLTAQTSSLFWDLQQWASGGRLQAISAKQETVMDLMWPIRVFKLAVVIFGVELDNSTAVATNVGA